MSFYGQFGANVIWFFGVVEDVNDPAMLGRVRVRVINEQDSSEVPTEDLLWAVPLSPIQSASLNSDRINGAQTRPGPSAVGISPTGIEVGSYAFGFFLDGEERNQPMVLATYHKIPGATRDTINSGEAAESSEHDVSALAREIQSLFKEETEGDLGVSSFSPLNVGEAGDRPFLKEPASAYNSEYPHNKTFTTKSGHAIEVDDTPGAERIHIYHRTGTYTEIDKNGRLVQKTVGSDWNVVLRNKNILVKGDYNVEVDGNATMLVKGNVYQYVGNSVVQAVEKNVSQTVGEDVTQTVGGDVTEVIGGDVNQTIIGNVTTEIEGNQEIIVHGDLKYAVDGNAEIVAKGTMDVLSVGDQTIGTDGDQTIVVGGEQTIGIAGTQTIEATLNTTFNNDVAIVGDVAVTGTVDATVDVLGGSSNISLIGHKHGGVTTGAGLTGVPQ